MQRDMELPQIKSTFVDTATNVTYHIMAYRPLSRDEMVQAIRYYRQQQKWKNDKAGTVVTITSLIR